MTEDDTVGRGKPVKDPVLDIMPWSGAMGYGDCIAADDNEFFSRQELVDKTVAGVAADCVDLLSGKCVQDGNISEVSGMDNYITPVKGLRTLPLKGGSC